MSWPRSASSCRRPASFCRSLRNLSISLLLMKNSSFCPRSVRPGISGSGGNAALILNRALAPGQCLLQMSCRILAMAPERLQPEHAGEGLRRGEAQQGITGSRRSLEEGWIEAGDLTARQPRKPSSCRSPGEDLSDKLLRGVCQSGVLQDLAGREEDLRPAQVAAAEVIHGSEAGGPGCGQPGMDFGADFRVVMDVQSAQPGQ